MAPTASNQNYYTAPSTGFSKRFLIYYQNVRGLRTKTADLLNSTSACWYDLMALTETWLDLSISDGEVVAAVYNVFRADRDFLNTGKSRGGGCLIAVNKKFNAFKIDVNQSVDLEPGIDIVGVKIVLDFSSILVFAVYLPPPVSPETLENLFECLTSLDCIFGNNICILGDFNLPNYVNCNNSQDKHILILQNFITFLNCNQSNSIQNSNNRILDLVINNNENCIVEKSLDPLLTEDTHHPALDISLKYCHSMNFKRKTLFNLQNAFNFKKANFPNLYDAFSKTDWSFMEATVSVEHQFKVFYDLILKELDSFVPKYPNIPRRNFPPWFTNSIIRDIKLKSFHYNKFKKYGRTDDINTFKLLRNKSKGDISKSYYQYVSNVESSIINNPNKFWSFIKN
ncbi:uncharacterized protein LOC126747999 [Anthonomus grandis grandis]|uniref:uncharacterized protein LOC126747999 n=1 Tax=Anthonomus grandis grandis TaxID=2921223 RepID=UPI002165CF87|nr:uncharacterized protein LOC126747999 [Anthonomus grandis grandis]